MRTYLTNPGDTACYLTHRIRIAMREVHPRELGSLPPSHCSAKEHATSFVFE